MILQILRASRLSPKGFPLKTSPTAFQNNIKGAIVRTFLSDAYGCSEEWNSRRSSDIMQNVKVDEYHHNLIREIEKNNKASAVDLDLLANAVSSPSHLDLMEEAIYRFRHGYNNWEMLESTQYAVLRALLDHKRLDVILDILAERIDYGIFLNYHIANLLMDEFIKQKNYRGASIIGSELMLQEELDNAISRRLILYSCHMYLTSPYTSIHDDDEMGNTSDSEAEEDDGEEWIFRTEYLKHPYFDDHFDIRKTKTLIGKTLVSVSPLHANIVGRSYMVIGYALYEKFDAGLEYLQHLLDAHISGNTGDSTEKAILCRQALEQFSTMLEAAASGVGGETSEAPTEENNNTMNESKLEAGADNMTRIKELLAHYEKSDLVSDDDLNDLVQEYVSSDKLMKYEQVDIESTKEMYEKWNMVREQKLKDQIHEYLKAEKIRLHKKQKQELAEKEGFLTYFDKKLEMEKIIPDLADLEELKVRFGGRLDEIYDTYESLVREEGWMERYEAGRRFNKYKKK